MTEFLVKFFVKDYHETEKMSVRTSYGMLASIVGIFCNVCLFLAKLVAGMFLHSVAVMADAFNNLSDAGASIISFVGVKMASKPADKEHPFGHGRIEYIAALVVAFLVIEVGLSFMKDSIEKLKAPREIQFHTISIVILLFSIGVKIWLAFFNHRLGKRIDSKVMKAAATDAVGDVAITVTTIISILVFQYTGVNIDAVVGIGVAVAIMFAGVNIARETLEPLIGQAVSQEVSEQITSFVEEYEGVEGAHELVMHNYGPGKNVASLHVELPSNIDVETAHTIIDRIEQDAMETLGLELVIHMEPTEH